MRIPTSIWWFGISNIISGVNADFFINYQRKSAIHPRATFSVAISVLFDHRALFNSSDSNARFSLAPRRRVGASFGDWR